MLGYTKFDHFNVLTFSIHLVLEQAVLVSDLNFKLRYFLLINLHICFAVYIFTICTTRLRLGWFTNVDVGLGII